MRPNIPHFWKIIAHETREKRRRIARTPRATHPVCVRMSLRSVARIVVSRKMMCPSAKIRIFLGVRNVAHAPSTRNQYDAGVSDSAAYQETGARGLRTRPAEGGPPQSMESRCGRLQNKHE